MNSITEDYLNIVKNTQNDAWNRKNFRTELEAGNAYWNHRVVSASYMPVCLSMQDRKIISEASETIYRVLCKVIRRYRTDAEFRREFRFDKRVEEMMLFPTAYDEELPLMRTDSVYDPETGSLYFCEFNTDASGGMTETLETTRAVKKSKPYAEFGKKYKVFTDEDGIFAKWADKLTQIWNSVNKVYPHLAIVVCFDNPDPDPRELETFIPYFERKGFRVSIYDVRNLIYDKGKLMGGKSLVGEDNAQIDVIWRFCIISDLLNHWNEVQDFISAMREGAVPLIGGLFTQIVADKQIFTVLGKFAEDEMFTEEERSCISEHIPYTAALQDYESGLDDLIDNKNRWIIKPSDMYASIGVVSGRSCSNEEWKKLLEQYIDESVNWLIQEFIEPQKSPAIPIYGNDEDYIAEPVEYGCLYGTYVYCGEYAGVYLRQGPGDVIGDARGGVTSEILWCEKYK